MTTLTIRLPDETAAKPRGLTPLSYISSRVSKDAGWGHVPDGQMYCSPKSYLSSPFGLTCFCLRRKLLSMSINVKLSEEFVGQARRYAAIEHRSVPKQIEYWSQIGKIAEENPDLPFAMIREILIADREEATSEYQFG